MRSKPLFEATYALTNSEPGRLTSTGCLLYGCASTGHLFLLVSSPERVLISDGAQSREQIVRVRPAVAISGTQVDACSSQPRAGN